MDACICLVILLIDLNVTCRLSGVAVAFSVVPMWDGSLARMSDGCRQT